MVAPLAWRNPVLIRSFILFLAGVMFLMTVNTVDARETATDPENTLYMDLDYGRVVIKMRPDLAPNHVTRIKELVRQGYYDGTPFHRVIDGFMAQGGAKTDEGEGGPGYVIRCECYQPNARKHFRGSLSMAHAGRDTGNSQFFLTFVPTPHLDGKHTVFGRVIEGLDVLGDIQRRNPQQPNQPAPDRIIKAEVVRDRGHEYTFEKLPER